MCGPLDAVARHLHHAAVLSTVCCSMLSAATRAMHTDACIILRKIVIDWWPASLGMHDPPVS